MASMGEVQVRVQVEHPLVCLNQHPEHQWEDSGLCLAKANRLGVVTREAGPNVEVCSRPGCGLIRVKQQREVQLGTKLKANEKPFRDALAKAAKHVGEIVSSAAREQFKELDSSVKRQAEMKSKPVLTIIDEAAGIEDEVYDKAQEWAKKKKPDLGWDNAFGKIEDEGMTEPGEASFSGEFCSRDGYEHGICSCGHPWRVKFTERTVFYCVECGGALVAGPEPNLPDDYKGHKKIVHATWVSRNVGRPLCEAQLRTYDELERQDKSKVTCKVCSRMLAETASSSPDFSLPQPGDPYSENSTMESVSGQVRCERCQCLTPVSELSRDAQGRMVCKHHG